MSAAHYTDHTGGIAEKLKLLAAALAAGKFDQAISAAIKICQVHWLKFSESFSHFRFL